MGPLAKVWVLKDLVFNGIDLFRMGIGLRIGGRVVAKFSGRTVNAGSIAQSRILNLIASST